MQKGKEIHLTQAVSEENARQTIEKQIEENTLLIYMKGSPQMPQCGFSARVVQIFNILGIEYKTFNVLSNTEIREGIKSFSDWPTIPQIYYNKEFLGGCDIITEMYQNKELEKLFS